MNTDKKMNYTHKGWFLFCPVWLVNPWPLDNNRCPSMEARRPFPFYWLWLNIVALELVIRPVMRWFDPKSDSFPLHHIKPI